MEEILLDTIKYFAKFPDKSAVLEQFKQSTEKVSGYDTLKTYIQSLPETSIIPEIKEYLFSTSEETLEKIIRNVKGYFLLFEYYAFSGGTPNNANVRDISWHLIVRVGYPFSDRNTDLWEEAIHMQNCLTYIETIANQMESDNDDLCFPIQFNKESFSINPIDPRLFYGKMGWSIDFNRNNNNLINA